MFWNDPINDDFLATRSTHVLQHCKEVLIGLVGTHTDPLPKREIVAITEHNFKDFAKERQAREENARVRKIQVDIQILSREVKYRNLGWLCTHTESDVNNARDSVNDAHGGTQYNVLRTRSFCPFPTSSTAPNSRCRGHQRQAGGEFGNAIKLWSSLDPYVASWVQTLVTSSDQELATSVTDQALAHETLENLNKDNRERLISMRDLEIHLRKLGDAVQISPQVWNILPASRRRKVVNLSLEYGLDSAKWPTDPDPFLVAHAGDRTFERAIRLS